MFWDQFLTIFSARGDSLIRNAESGSWRRMSQFHLLTDDEIIAALSESSTIIRAVSFDRNTKLAAITIPAYSPYLELFQFRRLLDLLYSLGLKPRTYKASGSDDVQLFLFLAHDVKSDVVAESLLKVLSWNGFSVRPEMLLVYPTGAALPLPLQRGFAWLNDDLQPIVSRMEISIDSALALFCSEATRYATDFERITDGANLLPATTLTDAECDFWGVAPQFVELTKDDSQVSADSQLSLNSQIAENSHISVVPDLEESQLEDSQILEELLEEGPQFSFACAMPEDQPAYPAVNPASDSLNAFPLWLVQEDLSVEVFPIPVDQEVIEEMLLDECADDLEQQAQAVQGQTAADDQWPRQTSQLLLVTNERPLDLQLDLFSARKDSNSQPPTPRSRRKRLQRLTDKPKPEV